MARTALPVGAGSVAGGKVNQQSINDNFYVREVTRTNYRLMAQLGAFVIIVGIIDAAITSDGLVWVVVVCVVVLVAWARRHPGKATHMTF